MIWGLQLANALKSKPQGCLWTFLSIKVSYGNINSMRMSPCITNCGFGQTIHVTCMTTRLSLFVSLQWWELCNRGLGWGSVIIWRGGWAQKVLIHLQQWSGAWSTVIHVHRCWDHHIINILCEWRTIFQRHRHGFVASNLTCWSIFI